jgi:hypothetical protein
MRLLVRVLFFEHTSDCLTNPLLDAFKVTVDRAMRVELTQVRNLPTPLN